ncbi:MAG: AsnC family transcriptional regulator [Thermoprotei archaeon]|nr:MAG: AsnC family transcriptional regulator [Thermoprotei archaeon]RLF25896.1 MAG: AsnC family transcriptional regulator [Thermoprotei archaeon]
MGYYEKQFTERQLRVLRMLYDRSKSMRVYTVEKSQSELAKELGITRQALSLHLRRLREEGLIRTGRGFIDLTEKALKVLGVQTQEAFVLIKVEPKLRDEAYRKIKGLPVSKLYRVTGEIDVIAVVDQAHLDEFLRKVSKIEGVERTSTHIVVQVLKE